MSGTPTGLVLGTACELTGFAPLRERLEAHRRGGVGPLAVDFTNVHIVAARRLEPAFREQTGAMDLFVPDSRILCRALRWLGHPEPECLFGPHFMDRFLRDAPPGSTHYLLGGSPACSAALAAKYGAAARIIGASDGYFEPAREEAVAEAIARAAPDYVWVGLGTPKQQAWIRRHKARFGRTVLLAVGFAFDVNAGLKRDAPPWMHRAGLVWLFRLCSEPGRLGWRYLYYSTAFLVLLAWQKLTGPRAPGTVPP